MSGLFRRIPKCQLCSRRCDASFFLFAGFPCRICELRDGGALIALTKTDAQAALSLIHETRSRKLRYAVIPCRLRSALRPSSPLSVCGYRLWYDHKLRSYVFVCDLYENTLFTDLIKLPLHTRKTAELLQNGCCAVCVTADKRVLLARSSEHSKPD